MKNVIITGLFIGILSGLWLFLMHAFGYGIGGADQVAPIEYFSVLIPFVGLYIGLRQYKYHEMGGVISFFDGLVHYFKILIVGGIVAVFSGIVYVEYVEAQHNLADFSGRIFGALLLGLLFSLTVSLMLMNKSKAI